MTLTEILAATDAIEIDSKPGYVLAKVGRGHHPYVTWAIGTDSVFWGHYYKDLAEAVNDFRDRGC